MKDLRMIYRVLKTPKVQIINSSRGFHVYQVLNHRELPTGYEKNENIDSSLFLTNLPSRKRDKRPDIVKGVLRAGTLAIQCKREEFDHYTGMHYGKFDEIPLASKAWNHKKSKGDYFTILPIQEHPAFLTKENLKITFEEIGISEKLIKQLNKLNITHPTVVQSKILEKLLQGGNVFISSECGSGKTLAYVIGMVENVLKYKEFDPQPYNSPYAIILLPTRELAIQVGQVVNDLGSDLGINSHTLIGGDIKDLMLHPEMINVDILVCTLRAMNKHLLAKLYSTEYCKHIVVDEVDTFVEESFINQLKQFLLQTKLQFTGLSDTVDTKQCAQICFASAAVSNTMEETVSDLIRGYNLEIVSTPYLNKVPRHVTQVFKRVGKATKIEDLLKIVKKNVKGKIPTMIFSNRLKTAHWLSLFLKENNIQCGNLCNVGYHSERLMHFSDFEAGLTDIISCTDLASRGLDFKRVKQVINYEFPTFMIDYIHRCGRVGRISQDQNGLITNFICRTAEIDLVHKIELAVRTNSPLKGIKENRERKIYGKPR